MGRMDVQQRDAVVVGGGPAGLMAAEVMAASGLAVTVFEHMPSVGRKLLLAGRSGLNLTHDEPLDRLLARYGSARAALEPAIRAFPPSALRAWAAGLGDETFVGTSGRVFPQAMRATPLLRAWLRRLDELGVRIETRIRWCGWDESGATVFAGADGTEFAVRSPVAVFALGGASWPRVGSDGGWVPLVRAAGVAVNDLTAANCGVVVPWGDWFVARHAGQPLRNAALRVGDATARGGVMITRDGLEGGPVYTLTAALRATIERDGSADLRVDLHPDLSVGDVAARLAKRRPNDSVSTVLRRTLGFTPTMVAFVREAVGGPLPSEPSELAALVKAVPVRVKRLAPLARAISSAGGVALHEVDRQFMLHRRPGTFVVGEMLDWEAPTGGYLLQATFSSAVAAAHRAVEIG